MQRKLKFRVWDKLSKTFIYPDKGYQGHYYLTLNGKFFNFKNGSGGEEYIVQQFTGLKDENGKEIYEGDIINYLNNFGQEYISSIVFCNGYFGLKHIAYDDYQCMPLGFNPGILGAITKNYQVSVIGNIFENPELLKNEN